MKLENMNDMVLYLKNKFSGEVYKATPVPLDEFGEVVKFEILWTASKPGFPDDRGFMWCRTDGRTAAVPFGK